MSLLRRTVPMLALVGAGVGSLVAQIPIRQPSGNAAANSPRLLVATTYTDRGSDSATAVTIANGLRTRMQRVVGTAYNVLTREQMNHALAEYSYPADAILNRESARRLATAMQARVLLFTDLGRQGGTLRVRARLAGLSDDAGNTLTLLQAPGQTTAQFGEAIAVAFTQAIKAQPDAKACFDNSTTNAQRANEAAQKSLRAYPAHGLAHMCLASLAHARSADDPAYAQELDAAVRGDSLSLKALGALADYYMARNDTNNVVQKWQQMIEADPTNRALIENGTKLLRSLGHPDVAEQVADRGIGLDSLDTSMWDLKSLACVFQSKYTCAITSLEQILIIDSTRADSNFLFRLAVTAGAGASDTASLKAKFLYWSRLGAQKFPTNKNILGQLMAAFSANTMDDSVPPLADRVFALDTTDVTPLLTAVDVELKAKRYADAARHANLVIAHGDADNKLAIAANFTNAARGLLSTQPIDADGAYTLLHIAVPAGGTDARIAPLANFLMGYAGLASASKLDADAAAQKSCDMARKMDGMVDESITGFTVGRSINPPTADAQLLAARQYKARTQSMITAYCH